MHIVRTGLYWTMAASTAALYGQAAGAPAQVATPSAAAPVAPSALLQPALDNVQATLNGVKLDRWKKGSVRDEAATNVASIERDVQTNVPPLLAEADAAPGSVSKAIPLLKHLDAVYDVLLRVEEGARVSAPSDQIEALQQALLKLSSARMALDDQLQTQAAAQEKQVAELQIAMKTQQAAQAAHAQTGKAMEPAPCKPATPARKKRTTPAKSTPAKTNAPPAGGQTAPQTPPKQ